MDKNILAVLSFLKPFGFTSIVNIAPKLNEIFPCDSQHDDSNWNVVKRNVIYFVDALETDGLIAADKAQIQNIGDVRDKHSLTQWFGFRGFEASITLKGLHELSQAEGLKMQNELNESIIKTNTSVQETNHSVIGISEKQVEINTKMADNSTAQTTILNGQKYVLWASVFIAACSAFISYLTYKKDDPNNQLRQEIKATNQRIDTILHKLSRTNRNDSTKGSALKIDTAKKP